MPAPYSVQQQHRDFLIVIGAALLIFAFSAEIQRLFSKSGTAKRATIFVDGMCCLKTATPALDELTRIDGVLEIAPNYRNRSIYLELCRAQAASPRSIWEAVEKTSLRPTRLVVQGRTFTKRPVE